VIGITNELRSQILGGLLSLGAAAGFAALVSLTVVWVHRHINKPRA